MVQSEEGEPERATLRWPWRPRAPCGQAPTGRRSGCRLLGALGGRRAAAPSPPPTAHGEDLCFDLSNEGDLDAVGSEADKGHGAVSEQGSTDLSEGGEWTDGLSSLGSRGASADDAVGSWTPSLDDLGGPDPNSRDCPEGPDQDDLSPRGLRHPDDLSADRDDPEWADPDDFSLDSICSADSAASEAYGVPSASSLWEVDDEEYEEPYYMSVLDEEPYYVSALACGRELYQEASDLFDRWKRLQARKRLACRVGKARPPGALVGTAPRSPRPNSSFDTTTGVEHVQEARKRWVRANSGGSIAYSFPVFVDGKMVI